MTVQSSITKLPLEFIDISVLVPTHLMNLMPSLRKPSNPAVSLGQVTLQFVNTQSRLSEVTIIHWMYRRQGTDWITSQSCALRRAAYDPPIAFIHTSFTRQA